MTDARTTMCVASNLYDGTRYRFRIQTVCKNTRLNSLTSVAIYDLPQRGYENVQTANEGQSAVNFEYHSRVV
jgi:hypothetical protein